MKTSIRKFLYATPIMIMASGCSIDRFMPQSEENNFESVIPLKQEDASAIVNAIQDEIYDYSQEKRYFRHGIAPKILPGKIVKVSVYINPYLDADGMGEAIYNNLPYGEILRVFVVKPTGMVLLDGGPQIGFPVTQPSHLTAFMEKEELSDHKAQWLHAELTIQKNPSKSTLVEVGRRQIERFGFSDYLKIETRGVSK